MRRAAPLFMAAAFAALPVFASGGEGGWFAPLWGLPTIAWQLLNFVLVIALFAFLLRGKLPAFFSGRAEEIRKELEKAVREKESALARLREVDLKMSHLQDEVDAIQKESEAAAEAEKARLLAEAEASRDRLRAEAKDEMERQGAAARKDLRAYAASLVERMAREEILRDLTARDEEVLMEDFLRKMESEDHDRVG
jgi:F-type H+-transporting ATPase subunit b